MTDGLVSVIVPAYNAENFIAEALDSAFAQDYGPLEVIVVDDGSSDRTADVASRYEVQLVRQPNRGPAAARNAGLALARGEYIAILDADDIWPADRVSVLVGALSTGAGIVMGLTEFFVTPGEPTPPHYPFGLPNPLSGHMVALLARRRVFELIGAYNEEFRLSEDIDWFMRAREAGAIRDDLDIVFGHCRRFEQMSRGQPVAVGPVQPAHVTSGLLVRRSALERTGPFRTGLLVAEALDWLLRARELGLREATVPELVSWRRVHGENNSLRNREAVGEFPRALKASLDRRRAAERQQ